MEENTIIQNISEELNINPMDITVAADDYIIFKRIDGSKDKVYTKYSEDANKIDHKDKGAIMWVRRSIETEEDKKLVLLANSIMEEHRIG